MSWQIDEGYNIKHKYIRLMVANPHYPERLHTVPTIQAGTLNYQGWAMGACSTHMVWGWGTIGIKNSTMENLAEFLTMMFKAQVLCGDSWNPHMIMCQVPAGKYEKGADVKAESPFFKLFKDTIYPGIEPVFTYPNRCHDSAPQRLFYFDTDIAFTWLEKYNAEQKKLAAASRTPADGGNGTIITPQCPDGVQQIQYFDQFR